MDKNIIRWKSCKFSFKRMMEDYNKVMDCVLQLNIKECLHCLTWLNKETYENKRSTNT